MDFLTLALFVFILTACVIWNVSIIAALLLGYGLFFVYGLYRGISAVSLVRLSWKGISTVSTIIIMFFLIGMVSATWRAGGTIPMIVTLAGNIIRPDAFLMITFLLNCLISVLTGTSFGTAATMGVICMSIGNAMGMNPVLMGGAILGGAFFGDRCSPMSTSALLVAELTHTDIFDNLRRMAKNAAVPFLVTCTIYYLLGRNGNAEPVSLEILNLFRKNFQLHYITLLPALLIILLSLLKIKVKRIMVFSIFVASLLCLFLQNIPAAQLATMLVFGYRCPDTTLAPMLNGGGAFSMLNAAAVIIISSSYSEIFKETHLLDGIKARIRDISNAVTPFGGMVFVSALTSMIACNQTLAAILTGQLCDEIIPENRQRALAMEDTVIVMAALVPWSIAVVVPCTTVGAPLLSVIAACYLYLQPVWSFILSVKEK